MPISLSALESQELAPDDLIYSDPKSVLSDESLPGHTNMLKVFDAAVPVNERQRALNKAFLSGHPLAVYIYAERIDDVDKKINYLFQASLKGYRPAAFRIGDILYRHGRGAPEDFPRALAAFLPPAKMGEPSAQFYVGRMYQLGHGTEVDGVKAAKWYRRAGENGQARAWNNLGNVYAEGLGVPKDIEKMMASYQKASEMGMAMGSYNLAKVYHYAKHGIEKDVERAEYYYRLTLERHPNYANAWYLLGNLLRYGAEEGDSDYIGAEKAYKNGVKQGDVDAMYSLASLYYKEKQTSNRDNIIELLEQAANEGHEKANLHLGNFYKTGKFVRKNIKKAVHHYEKAAEAGNAEAQNLLAIWLSRTGVEAPCSPRVIELFEASAQSKNLNAMANLGYRIAYGRVSGEDPARGVALLEAAAKQKLHNAIAHLSEISEKPDARHVLTPEQREKWKAEKASSESEAKEAATSVLREVAPLLQKEEWKRALAHVDKAFHDWEDYTKDIDSYLGRLWWDAQTQQGRINPEWSVILFEWLDREFSQEVPHDRLTRLIVCSNISAALAETGQLARHRALARRTEELLMEVEGIDVRRMLDDYKSGRIDELPLTYDQNRPSYSGHIADTENTFTYAVMFALRTLAKEHFYQAEWKDAEIILDWIERWCDSAQSGETLPLNTNSNHVQLQLTETRLLRARIKEVQGDNEEAMSIYDAIISESPKNYRGRYYHKAIRRRAFLAASLEQWDRIDIAELLEVEKLQSENRFANISAPEYTKLARAWAMYGQGSRDEGFALVLEVLLLTEEKELPFLRLSALEIASRLALLDIRLYSDSSQSENIESWLIEALTLIREKGLKAREPDFYNYYAQWLWLSGLTVKSAEIKQKQVRLLESLGLQERSVEVSEAKRDKTTLLQSDVKKQNRTKIDLQPKYISSVPIKGMSARPVFTLSNLRDYPVKALLKLTGDISYTTVGGQGEKLQIKLQSGLKKESLETEIHLVSLEQLIIEVVSPQSLIPEEGINLVLIAVGENGDRQSAELFLDFDAANVDSAIIDAAEILSNPYYWIPVFHNLDAIVGAEDSESIVLRAQASQPTRIEVYDSDGNLLFVDATGNGSFDESGDIIRTDRVFDGYPVFKLDQPNQRLEFLYQKLDSDTSEPVRIEIQRANITDEPNLEWGTDVEDHIRYKPRE